MSLVDFEVEEIQKLCENVVPCSKLITCTSLLVRVDIKLNETRRQLTVCLRFPEGYPQLHILVEIKSKLLGEKFADGLTTLCEQKAKEQLGKPQCLHVLKFVEQYLRENPLCVVYEEILELKKCLSKQEASEQLKLRQKSATVQLLAKGGPYYYRVKAEVPENYPVQCVLLKEQQTNLPAVLMRYLNGQSKEIARQCVEPPLRWQKDKNALANFQPSPSLFKALKFCLDATTDFYLEQCVICERTVLPANPHELVLDETHEAFVERAYCGHLFHQGCLKRFLQEPPFPKGGKLCPAKKSHPRSDALYYQGATSAQANSNTKANARAGTMAQQQVCGLRLAHDRWVINPKVAETRWAQKQARERELQEVVDFLQ